MKNDLMNRERRLRYAAEKKGLHIQKKTCEPITGYLISREDSQLVIAGYGHYRNLVPLDEAEQFIAEY